MIGTALRRTGSGWTPAVLSPYLWLDASQLAGLNDGDPISTFPDASGNGRTFTGSGAARPTFKSNIINGKPVARFAGSQALTSSVALNFGGGQQLSYWIVTANITSGADEILFETSANINAITGGFLHYRDNANKVQWAYRGTFGYDTTNTLSTVTSAAAAFLATLDISLATNEVSLYLNSTTSAQNRTQNNNNTDTLGSFTCYIGARGASSLFLNGDIAEIGAVSSVLSTADRSSLMNYLGTKYGITIA